MKAKLTEYRKMRRKRLRKNAKRDLEKINDTKYNNQIRLPTSLEIPEDLKSSCPNNTIWKTVWPELLRRHGESRYTAETNGPTHQTMCQDRLEELVGLKRRDGISTTVNFIDL